MKKFILFAVLIISLIGCKKTEIITDNETIQINQTQNEGSFEQLNLSENLTKTTNQTKLFQPKSTYREIYRTGQGISSLSYDSGGIWTFYAKEPYLEPPAHNRLVKFTTKKDNELIAPILWCNISINVIAIAASNDTIWMISSNESPYAIFTTNKDSCNSSGVCSEDNSCLKKQWELGKDINPVSMTINKNNIYIIHEIKDYLYTILTYGNNGSLIDGHNFDESSLANGISWDGKNFWISSHEGYSFFPENPLSDYHKIFVSKFDNNFKNKTKGEFLADNNFEDVYSSTYGITSNQTTLWLSDADNGIIYQWDIDS